MKRALLLTFLLSIPALASAQTKLSETWSTYCDGTTEIVRVVFVYHAGSNIVAEESGGELWASSVECGGVGSGGNGIATALDGGDYAFTWTMLRSAIAGPTAIRYGRVMMRAPDDQGGLITQFFPFECTDGPQAIVDNSDCTTLSVASKTWGAIKALYR